MRATGSVGGAAGLGDDRVVAVRPLSADTWYAQNQPGATWRVYAEVKPRNTFAGDPFHVDVPLANLWSDANYPYRVVGQLCDLTASACAGVSAGVVLHALRSDAAGKVGVRRLTYTGALLPATPPVDVATLAAPYAPGLRGSTPAIAQVNGEVRLVYADGTKVRWLRSLDEGRTWSAAQTLYDGVGAYVRYSNFALRPDAAGRWVLGYSAWTPSGQIRVRGAHDVGEGWVNWPVCPTNVDWQVAGLPGAASIPLSSACPFYLWGRNYTWSTIAVGVVRLTEGAFTAWWERVEIVDRSGLEGETSYDRVRTGDAFGAYWLTMQEGPANGRRYWVRASLWGVPGSNEMEEPVLLSDGDADESLSPYEHLQLVSVPGMRAALAVGAVRYAVLANTVGNAVVSLPVLGYCYEQHLGGGGRLTLRTSPGRVEVDPGAPLRSDLAVHPGDVIDLQRTVSAYAASGALVSGSDRRSFRVASVTHGERIAEIVAYDGPGLLWQHRLRRAKILRSGDRTRADDLRSLIVWAGVKPDRIEPPDADRPSPGFVAGAGLTLGGALTEYLRKVAAIFRPGRIEGGSIAVNHPSVSVAPASWAPEADAPALHLLRRSDPTHVLAEIVHRFDTETLTESASDALLVVVIGMKTTDPAAGEDWRMRVAQRQEYGRVRPFPQVYQNPRWTGGDLDAVATAEGGRSAGDTVLLRVRCPAHLGVELFDSVRYRNDDQRLWRVVEIVERFGDGRIDQEIGLR